jgi:putative spermidine/putrescine transport system ATP-binding protein
MIETVQHNKAGVREQHDSPTVSLVLRGLTKRYAGVKQAAVENLDMEVDDGHLVALLGPSGCGKTTTLRMVAGLMEPTDGHVVVKGRDVTRTPVHKRGMGMVFQSYALFPHMNVAANIEFGLQMRRIPKTERRTRVTNALKMVQLDHLAERRVKDLSGGQQQRIALARALVVEPSLLLLDEPLSNLDAKLRETMRSEIRQIQQRLGTTTLFVTHDQQEALDMADRVAVMNLGRIEQFGSPSEIYEKPATMFVADFIGQANFLPIRIARSAPSSSADSRYVVESPSFGSATSAGVPSLAAGPAILMVRPHQVRTVPVEEEPGDSHTGETIALRGVVTNRSYVGNMVSYSVECGEETIKAESLTAHGTMSRPGDEVRVIWNVADSYVLPGGLDGAKNGG